MRYIRHNPIARHCRSGNYNLCLPMASDSVSWNLGGVMVPLIIFILGAIGTGFNVSRAWSIFALFTLSIGYPLTWLGIIGFWMLRLLCFG